MKKTPIIELIDLMYENFKSSKDQCSPTLVLIMLKNALQKEKAFAFDCYQSGLESWTWDYTYGLSDVGTPTFEEFYLQFANHE